MNVRKPIDYSAMSAALDTLMAADQPQMELYCEIGRLVSERPEKGAAVAAAEYLNGAYPDATGFSPRNLRRMREFSRTYEGTPDILAMAMTIGWTQNVVILEAELTIQERAWYIRAARQFGWSKVELQRKIEENAHCEIILDFEDEVCYTEEKISVAEGDSDVRQMEKADRLLLRQKWEDPRYPFQHLHRRTGGRFRDPVSGKFDELMLIRDGKNLSEFLRRYQVEKGDIKREW